MEDHDFWQDFLNADEAPAAPFDRSYPARLPDGRVLLLPIRPLKGTRHAIASLILGQASFAVEAALADALAERLKVHAPEIVIGLPTLGLSLARAVAQRLGHARYVPLGTSRKFWYDPALSVPLSSITSPDSTKRLYLDPRLLPLLEGRRTAMIDDAISTGSSMRAGLELLDLAGRPPVVLGAAMLQTERWRGLLDQLPVEGAFRSPLLEGAPGAWRVAANQAPPA
ncbi:phosphoribosyltransferase [Roseicyclus sp. F158]|uniref:Phosphoribosyltransferase n=1 Tax=Tropicimonas omnivorans TaxID=3075590 RepID=A0ABU3DHQ5_9RHOB|nr:phosphoribosyltransferase [Roseicyclus sp. F158]MDT0683222.1 phosphoribosyltransferase [Roseicyclus sp. F158]